MCFQNRFQLNSSRIKIITQPGHPETIVVAGAAHMMPDSFLLAHISYQNSYLTH